MGRQPDAGQDDRLGPDDAVPHGATAGRWRHRARLALAIVGFGALAVRVVTYAVGADLASDPAAATTAGVLLLSGLGALLVATVALSAWAVLRARRLEVGIVLALAIAGIGAALFCVALLGAGGER